MFPNLALDKLRQSLKGVKSANRARNYDVSHVSKTPILIITNYQEIIQLGSQARLHCLEVPRRDYTHKWWSEVRALQLKLLLKEVVASYRKGLWVFD